MVLVACDDDRILNCNACILWYFLSTVFLYVILIKLIHITLLINDKHGRMPLYKQVWIVGCAVQCIWLRRINNVRSYVLQSVIGMNMHVVGYRDDNS